MFDVTKYLKENAFNGEYSLFDDKNGGLFAATPVDSPRDLKRISKDKKAFEDSRKYDSVYDMPDYELDFESSLQFDEDPQNLSANELEWLNKSEDEIRSRIFELAEEIQQEMYVLKARKSETYSRQSETATEHSSSSHNDAYFTPSSKRSSSEADSSPALSSYVAPHRRERERMPYLSLDKPMGHGPSSDEDSSSRSTVRRSSAISSGRQTLNRSDGLVDWRVAARTAEQNKQRSEHALGGFEEDRHGAGAKRRLCRHFLKGFCNRGDTCDFLHDNSIFCPDEQKVFLGGLPTHITADTLCTLLKEMNYTVINKPKILRGFTPQVCLSSISEAQELIRKKKIYLDNTPVDVRPYEDRKPPGPRQPSDDLKRSVFLGGLAADTTVEDIKEDLAQQGFPVENNPILKAGFVPQVVLESVEKAQELIKMAKIRIKNKAADVRPYVNFRKRY